ncbi:MAG: caspase family protein [Marinicellaceae bacterium]
MKNIILLLLIFSIHIKAADRALIIGITEYQQNKYNLKGIDLDVSMAKKISQILGFNPENTKTITGKEATRANIEQVFKNWLIKGVNKKDRVFIYFSGHGGHFKDENGDEADGYDEYITTHDLGDKKIDGGYILDDNLSEWIKAIPSEYKMVMLDSCHSGTATRGIIPTGQQMGKNVLYSKKHSFGQSTKVNIMSKSQSNTVNSGFLDGHTNTLTLAAAHDFEAAQASDKGSLFTIGVYKALAKAAQNGTSPSALDIIEEAGSYIAQLLANDLDYIHKPLLFGDKQLAKNPLGTKPSRNSEGPNWQEWTKIVSSGLAFDASINQTEFNEGELITFTANIPTQGFLNVVNIDAHDVVTILYPNQFNPENNIEKGTLEVPGSLMPFEIEAVKPKGDSLTVFVVTTEPLNLYKQSLNVRNAEGEFIENFADIDEHSYRGMKIRAKKKKSELYTTAIQSKVK